MVVDLYSLAILTASKAFTIPPVLDKDLNGTIVQLLDQALNI
jgi:hypothetical protein